MSEIEGVIKNICVYPNPNSGTFFVSFCAECNIDEVDIEVLNKDQIIYSTLVKSPLKGKEIHKKIDFSSKPLGTYSVKVKVGDKSVSMGCTKMSG